MSSTSPRSTCPGQVERGEVELCERDFATIDLPGAEAELAASRERLAALLQPDSDASSAKQAYQGAHAEPKRVEPRIKEIDKAIALLENDQERAESRQKAAADRVGEDLSDQEAEIATTQIPIPPKVSAEDLAETERAQCAETIGARSELA